MKVIGIIAEYNPFHNGHAYQLDTIRQNTGADYIIVAMSGNFVQRGTPAIIDKYTRAKMALSCGADLIIELPTLWATSSAEFFAMAGITLFDKAGCVDGICFGAETDNLPLLKRIADILADEPQQYRNALSSYLRSGLPFPAARANALCDHFADTASDTVEIGAILTEPNNILAIEYLKAIRKRGSSLTPYLIQRTGAGYHETVIRSADTSLMASTNIPSMPFESANTLCNAPTASATAIRGILSNYKLGTNTLSASAHSMLSDAIPQTAFEILEKSLSDVPPLQEDDFSSILSYLLLSKPLTELAEIADCNNEIANRLWKNRFNCTTFSEFCAYNKSRDITYTRMSRILIHLILNITSADYEYAKALDYIPYLRVLGFRRDSSTLLRALKESATVPLISKLTAAPNLLTQEALRMLEKDIFAANLYEQTLSQKAKTTTPRNEYTREIVIL